MPAPMHVYAEIAARYGVDPTDDDAVDTWYSGVFHELDLTEQDCILAELLEREDEGEPEEGELPSTYVPRLLHSFVLPEREFLTATFFRTMLSKNVASSLRRRGEAPIGLFVVTVDEAASARIGELGQEQEVTELVSTALRRFFRREDIAGVIDAHSFGLLVSLSRKGGKSAEHAVESAEIVARRRSEELGALFVPEPNGGRTPLGCRVGAAVFHGSEPIEPRVLLLSAMSAARTCESGYRVVPDDAPRPAAETAPESEAPRPDPAPETGRAPGFGEDA